MNTERPLAEIYMHTSNGRKYYPFAPKPSDVSIEVIAHHLATRARWNGATQHPKHVDRIFLSVAEHSVYVERYVREVMKRPDLSMAALLHDASEAFNGDLIRPLKYSAEFAEPFKRVEDLNEGAVARRFNIPLKMPPEIKIADEAVCTAESLQIIPKSPNEEWTSGKLHDETHVAPYEIEMLLPYQARRLFLDHYQMILSMRAVSA